jgi:uncharacterized protein GlcG (DUF336 family)
MHHEESRDAFQKSSISAEAARRIIATGEEKARKMNLSVSLAVYDADGTLKAFSRMDGAPLLSVQWSQDKAYTAASSGRPTHEWWDLVKDDEVLLHGIIKTDRLIVFGGGYPITIAAGVVVGGIGVSGGHYEEDMLVAEAALAGL